MYVITFSFNFLYAYRIIYNWKYLHVELNFSFKV